MAIPTISEIPVYAEMVLGEFFSGWAWEEPNPYGYKCILFYRLHGGDAFSMRHFKTWEDVEQFCDGLEGETDEFLRD